MRLKLAEQEDLAKDHHIRQKIRERQAEVDKMLAELGAETVEVAEATPYAFRYRLRYAGDTRRLATEIEQIEGAEVLSFGSALELIKDLGDASRVSEQYGLGGFRGTHGIGHTRMLIVFSIQHRGILRTARIQTILTVAALLPLFIVCIVPVLTGDVVLANFSPFTPLAKDASGAIVPGTWDKAGWLLFLGGLFIAAWSAYAFETAVCYMRSAVTRASS